MSCASRAMLVAVLALGACTAESQSGPGIVTAAGNGKSLAEFRQDDADCRRDAAAPIGTDATAATMPAAITTSGDSPRQHVARYTVCLRAKGYRIVPGSADYPLVTTGLLPAFDAGGGSR